MNVHSCLIRVVNVSDLILRCVVKGLSKRKLREHFVKAVRISGYRIPGAFCHERSCCISELSNCAFHPIGVDQRAVHAPQNSYSGGLAALHNKGYKSC